MIILGARVTENDRFFSAPDLFFAPNQLHVMYKAKVLRNPWYSNHVWGGGSRLSLLASSTDFNARPWYWLADLAWLPITSHPKPVTKLLLPYAYVIDTIKIFCPQGLAVVVLLSLDRHFHAQTTGYPYKLSTPLRFTVSFVSCIILRIVRQWIPLLLAISLPNKLTLLGITPRSLSYRKFPRTLLRTPGSQTMEVTIPGATQHLPRQLKRES